MYLQNFSKATYNTTYQHLFLVAKNILRKYNFDQGCVKPSCCLQYIKKNLKGGPAKYNMMSELISVASPLNPAYLMRILCTRLPVLLLWIQRWGFSFSKPRQTRNSSSEVQSTGWNLRNGNSKAKFCSPPGKDLETTNPIWEPGEKENKAQDKGQQGQLIFILIRVTEMKIKFIKQT